MLWYIGECRYYGRESVLDIVLSAQSGTFGLTENISNALLRRARLLLEELHIGDKLDYPFMLLSKGERQNVLIARALLLKPEILVLDEPCTGLDILAREHLQNTVHELANQTDMTMIYVTHHVEEILPVFKQALLLSHGHIWAQGKVEALFTPSKLSTFLGYPVEAMSRPSFGAHVHSSVYDLLGGIGHDC